MTLILVHAPKGGTGSTFVTAQLALGLARREQSVTAIDCTYQDSLKLHFGQLPSQVLATLGDGDHDTAVVSGVALINGHALSRASADHGDDAIDPALFPADQVSIVDIAAGDLDLKRRLMPLATLHVCVLLPTAGALAVLPLVDATTPTVALPKTVFVLNQTDDRWRMSRHAQAFMRMLLGDTLIGTVRRDEAVNEALAMLAPIEPFAPSSVVLADLDVLTAAIERRCGLAAESEPVAGAAS